MGHIVQLPQVPNEPLPQAHVEVSVIRPLLLNRTTALFVVPIKAIDVAIVRSGLNTVPVAAYVTTLPGLQKLTRSIDIFCLV